MNFLFLILVKVALATNSGVWARWPDLGFSEINDPSAEIVFF